MEALLHCASKRGHSPDPVVDLAQALVDDTAATARLLESFQTGGLGVIDTCRNDIQLWCLYHCFLVPLTSLTAAFGPNTESDHMLTSQLYRMP